MGCLSSSALPTQGLKRGIAGHGRGYSTLQFLKDYLVPLESFVCPVEKRAEEEELAAELLNFHQKRLSYYRPQLGIYEQEKLRRFAVVGERVSAPHKAWAKLRLAGVDIEGAEGSCIDFSDEAAALECRVFGAILVPRRAEWKNPPRGDKNQDYEIDTNDAQGTDAMVLGVELWCMMRSVRLEEDQQDEELDCNDVSRGIIIEVKHCVFKTNVLDGDPMVESWLPVNDIMQCVQLVLNSKLEFAWAEQDVACDLAL